MHGLDHLSSFGARPETLTLAAYDFAAEDAAFFVAFVDGVSGLAGFTFDDGHFQVRLPMFNKSLVQEGFLNKLEGRTTIGLIVADKPLKPHTFLKVPGRDRFFKLNKVLKGPSGVTGL